MNFPPLDFYERFKATPGAIGCGEAAAIAWLAEQAPTDGLCIDIGTNAGRAASSAAQGLGRHKIKRVLHGIDPVFDLDNAHALSQSWQKTKENIGWAWVFEPDFKDKVTERIVKASDGFVTPDLHGMASMDALPMLTGTGEKVAWVFVDADNHQYELVHAECFLLKDRMMMGGIIAFHDFQNQYLDVERCYRELLSTGNFHEIGVPWQDINPWIDANVDEWKDNGSWHACPDPHPHFVGALRRVK